MFGQLQELRHTGDVITQSADIDAAQAHGFRREQAVLRADAGINRANQQGFRPFAVRVGNKMMVFVIVHTKDQKLRRFNHMLLVFGNFGKALAQGGISDANDVHALHKA